MPLLFGSIGAEIDFKTIHSSLWPKAVLLIFVGAPAAMLCGQQMYAMQLTGSKSDICLVNSCDSQQLSFERHEAVLAHVQVGFLRVYQSRLWRSAAAGASR